MSLFGIGNFDVVSNGGSGIQYKGSVATKAELEAITEKHNGDVYLVTSENKKYIWSAKDNAWQLYADGGLSETDVRNIVTGYQYATQAEVTTALAGKVNVETGKGLSSNDFTDAEKTKLANAITEHQSLAEYAKKAEVPSKTSQLTNDSGFLTEHQDISGKVDKVEGSRLMSNDEGTKLAGIEAGAQVNVIKEEAPKDNKQYARKNGAWAEVEGGGPTPVVDPTVTIVSCPDALNVGDTLEVKAKGIKGTYDLLDLALYFDGTKVNHRENPVSDTEYTLTYDIPTSLEKGKYDVTVVIEADGGSTPGEASKDLVIGIAVEITECPETGKVGEEITIKAIPTKGKWDVETLLLIVDEITVDRKDGPVSGQEYSLKYTPSAAGTNIISVEASDLYGNTATEGAEIKVTAVVSDNCYFGVWNCESEVPEEQFYVALDPVAGMPTQSKSATYTYNYTLTEYQKPVYKYPKKFGDLTSITDGATQYFDSFEKDEETIGGQVYNVYTAKSETDYRNTTLYFS